jgi:thiamine biosynthesis lipoprotein
LSRYIENSDVSHINDSPVGEEIIVDDDTIKCLQIAQNAYELTDGAFNVAIGNLIAARKQGDNGQAQQFLSSVPNPEMVELNTEAYTVRVLQKGINIDLGGIGKGYAVDAIANILAEWGIKKAIIHAGASSVRALKAPAGKAGWPVIIRNPIDESVIARLELADEVLSCSGLQQGDHIVNPFTGQPVTGRRACWIRTKQSAALTDALTTAGMIMPVSSMKSLHEKLPDLSVMLLMDSETDQSWEIIRQGDWPN